MSTKLFRDPLSEYPCSASTGDLILVAAGNRLFGRRTADDVRIIDETLPASVPVRGAACGLVLGVNGKAKSFVVAGGISGGAYLTNVLVFDLVHKTANVRPMDLGGLAFPGYAGFGRSFLAFGGADAGQYLDSVLMYGEDGKFRPVKQLSFKAWSLAAMRVSSELFCKPGKR